MVAEEMGLSTLFIGANREKDLPQSDEWSGFRVERKGRYYPMLNGQGFGLYIKGLMSFNFKTFKYLIKVKPEIVHISDIESYWSGFLYCKIYRKKMIYNIHDNLAQRYQLSKKLKWILNNIEGIAVKCSSVALVPEEFRRASLPNYCKSKVKVVKNTPEDISEGLQREFQIKEQVTIFYAGWMDEGRGIHQLIEIVNALENAQLICAGEGDNKIIEMLKSHEKVNYLGFLTHKEIMDYTNKVDFVYACYNPCREINLYAAPNKLAEALSTGCPVIVNSEAKVSYNVEQYHCGIVAPYGNVDEITQQIKIITQDPNVYNEMSRQARKLFEKEYSWIVAKSAMQQTLNQLIAR